MYHKISVTKASIEPPSLWDQSLRFNRRRLSVFLGRFMALIPQPEPLLIDVHGAAAYVGVGTGTIRRWTADGLPFVRAGRCGKKLYDRADLRRFVERLKESAI